VGEVSYGGGIYAAGDVTLTQSSVIGNSTVGAFSYGGGIHTRVNVTLTRSTVSGNSTAGSRAWGGGIFSSGAVELTQSTVSGNSTAGEGARGGGIFSNGAVTLTRSTVSGNSTAGISAYGGGIRALDSVTLTQSTVSGNSTAGDFAGGGGIWIYRAVTLIQSTVTDNHTLDATAMGGGVFQSNTLSNHPFSISGSIVAGNTAVGGGDDLVKDPDSTLTINYSLIGVPPAGGFVGSNNITGLDPLLGPLADNGGPIETHALLAGSPAIDAGDPSIVFNPAEHDQRGAPFARVSGGRIDIGAFEVQSIIVPPDLLGDYNLNGVVDAADYVVWRKTLGTTGVPAYAGADGNGDTLIDQTDYGVWRANFGRTLLGSGAESEDPHPSPLPEGEGIGSTAGQVRHGESTTSSGTQATAPASQPPALPGDGVETKSIPPLGRPSALFTSRRDDVLVAWLSSQVVEASGGDGELIRLQDVAAADEPNIRLDDAALDAVFASLTVGQPL
jgi:hypothetical protein